MFIFIVWNAAKKDTGKITLREENIGIIRDKKKKKRKNGSANEGSPFC